MYRVLWYMNNMSPKFILIKMKKHLSKTKVFNNQVFNKIKMKKIPHQKRYITRKVNLVWHKSRMNITNFKKLAFDKKAVVVNVFERLTQKT